MMVVKRKFKIEKPGESESAWRDAYETVRDLKELGIKTSTTTIYKIQKGDQRLFNRPNKENKFPHVKVTCIR